MGMTGEILRKHCAEMTEGGSAVLGIIPDFLPLKPNLFGDNFAIALRMWGNYEERIIFALVRQIAFGVCDCASHAGQLQRKDNFCFGPTNCFWSLRLRFIFLLFLLFICTTVKGNDQKPARSFLLFLRCYFVIGDAKKK
jgi:hypothetical protein